MHDELVKELRRHHCDAKEDDTQEVCEECAYDVIIADKSVPSGISSVCVCGLMNRAADAIEELSREAEVNAKRAMKWAFDAEEAEAKLRWIPVAERLPNEIEDVLIYGEWIGVSGTTYREIWLTDMKSFLHQGYKPIAWMPLPEPPEEET